MLTRLAWLLLFSSLFLAAESMQMPVSYFFAESTIRESKDTLSDAGFLKLIDGDKSTRNRVVWCNKDFRKQPVKIEFSFGAPAKFSRVKIYYHRGPRSYGLKHIKVFGSDADGALFAAGSVVLNQPYVAPEDRPRDRPEEVEVLLPDGAEVATDKLVVEVASSGSYISLQEVEFFGVAEPAAAAPSINEHPYLPLTRQPSQGLRMRQEGKLWLLENDLVLYVIDPENNGCVNLAWDKAAGKNLIKFGDYANYGGMFNDRFWPGGTSVRDMYKDVKYQCVEAENKDSKKALRLSATGKAGIYANVTVEKIFSLTADSPVLQADYKITNDQANVMPLDAGLWLMGGVTDGGRSFGLIYPGASKVEYHDSKVQTLYATGAVSGWTAMINQDHQGLALLTDYQLLNSFLYWSNDNWNSTLECRMGVYSIEADSSLNMSFALVPFQGVGIPSDINRDCIVSLGLPTETITEPQDLQLMLLPFFRGEYTVKIEAGLQQGKKLELVEVASVAGVAEARPVTIPYQLPSRAGTWVVQATVSHRGRKVSEVSESLVFQKASGAYMREPASEKRPETGVTRAAPKLNFNSLSFVTEHVKWAKPFAGRKPRVLLVCRDKGGVRDLLEVAQRCDLEVTTNFIGGIWRLSGQTTSLNVNDCFAELQKVLKDKFDCLVVASDIWKTMPTAVRDAVLLQVEGGTGMVLIAPEGLPEQLDPNFRLLPDNARHFIAAWGSPADHPITNGVPFEALPPTRALKYDVPGTVLARVGEEPLLATFNYGRGKVAAASWATDGRERDGYYQQYTSPVVLPVMLYNPPENIDYHYWEYQISLLAKMIYWTAGCDTNVQGKLAAELGSLKAELQAEKAQQVQLQVTIRDKSYQVTQEISQEVTLKAGKNDLQVQFRLPDLGGWCFADCRVVGEKGVEWWGTAVCQAPAAVSMVNLDMPEKIWKKEEMLTGKVRLAGQAAVRLTLTDSFGNVFAQGEGTDFSLPLRDCRTYTCMLLVEVVLDGKVVDRLERVLLLHGRPDEREMQISFGWPSMSSQAVQHFLTPYYLQLLRGFGANAMKPFRTDVASEIMQARRLGMPFVCSLGLASSGGKFPYDTSVKPETKFDLLRKPCLSEPNFKDHLEEDNAQAAPGEEFGVIYRCGPDESNSISSWEGCFSPACQQEFRRWLQGVYGNLTALNASWLTDYREWDDVVAMTSEEVRGRGSYAPWLDHRSFNDWNRSDAIARIVKGIKRYDPLLRYSLSGTQESKALNAWEWHGIMQSLDAIESYVGEQTVMQRSFSKGSFPWSVWIGYDATYDSMNERMLSTLFQGATGFCIYSGRFYVNPDYTIPPAGVALQKVIARYKDGFAESIMNAETLTYPIAFYYSPASIKLDWLLDWEKHRLGGVLGTRTLLQELNLSYDYVAAPQVETDRRALNAYKVLYLSMNTSLTAAETAALREFVDAGGTLLAELALGGYDGHGKPQANNLLTEVFGVRVVKDELVARPAVLRGLSAPGWPSLTDLQLPVQFFNQGVAAEQATVLAQVVCEGETYPGITVNKFGRGRAIFLASSQGTAVNDWAEMRYAGSNLVNLRQLKVLWEHLLAEHAIVPKVSIPTLTAAQVFTRRNGSMVMAAVARNSAHAKKLDPQPKAHAVKLADKYHVYDFFARKYLGETETFDYEFGPATQAAFVLLPYRPSGIDAVAQRQQRRVTLKLQLAGVNGEAVEHLYRVRLQDPAGKVSEAYNKLLFAPGGKAEYTLVLPMNAPAGKWQATIEEMLSACQTTVEF